MKFRQVHLDFHTSEHIPNVGADFDKAQFQAALKKGHVDSITVFSKCHHGWSYHPTKVNRMHPTLTFDLFGAQIEAAHEIGVKAPGYISAGFDEKSAVEHPEWIIRNRDQSMMGSSDFSRAGYHMLCLHSPYLDELLAQVREMCENYNVDGVFMDITSARVCYCHSCVRTMRERGLNPYDEKNARAFGEEVYANYTRAVRETVDSVKPGLPIFHNAGATPRGRRDLEYMSSHTEIESLPTAQWSYDNLPMIARYVQPHGRDFLGMTGKFHTGWGEFGGYKHPNALIYETSLAVANGGKCSIGDQLHPLGKMDDETYRIIGEAYAKIEEKEPWLDGVSAVADIGLLSFDAYLNKRPEKKMPDDNMSDVGALRLLLEGHYLFDVLDEESDFTPYKLLILPDRMLIDASLQAKLDAFVAKGGKLLASGMSCLLQTADATDFAYDLGVKYEGSCEIQPIYMTPTCPIGSAGVADYVLYAPAELTSPADGKVFATVKKPYFARTAEHFCSHRHAPQRMEDVGVGASLGRNGAYVASHIFREYAASGSQFVKQLICKAIDLCLDGQKTLSVELPGQGVATLMDQKEQSRLVLHLLYAPRTVKGAAKIEVIEDCVPLYSVPVSIRSKRPIKRVLLAPSGEELAFTRDGDRVCFEVPKVEIHAMVVLEHGSER